MTVAPRRLDYSEARMPLIKEIDYGTPEARPIRSR